uniref:Uncharacterized protein n=1 Tax=Tetradesmus obliquus TaxID=3088 RepID=A0A383WPM3_TETOB|eukprot:jgi/Sobl393_1/18806/SZX79114.1
MYTARQYVQAQGDGAAAAAAIAALAQLVRVRQLSKFALRCSALRDGDRELLGSYDTQLMCLCLERGMVTATEEDAELRREWSKGAPASWQLGPRQIRAPEDGALLQWRLSLERLQQACRGSFAQQRAVFLHSPNSPPFGGVAWRMMLECYQRDGVTVIGLRVAPVGLPAIAPVQFKFSVAWLGSKATIRSPESAPQHACELDFGLQPMAGDGWDAKAWAAARLPTTGETLLELWMHSVY